MKNCSKAKESKNHFMAQAEEKAREAAKPRNLKVWRGKYKGFIIPGRNDLLDCVLIGKPDEKDPPESASILLAISIDTSGFMRLVSQSEIRGTPFQANPLGEFQMLLSKLPYLQSP